ncbi:MAG: hypothetical protein AB7F35_10065 [Acetobacteraceae bacterium]
MSQDPNIPLLDHQLAEDEVAWMRAVYTDFAAARAECAGKGTAFDPKETLREVLGRDAHRLPGPMDLTGPGPWRNGRNRHGRFVAAVFLPKAELHRHARSRTDQFAMYVRGEADAFALDASGHGVLTPVSGGDHFHNAPGAPHAFVPKAGQVVPEDWEIAFLAITPRNLREDTQAVSPEVKAVYEKVVGRPAPAGV